MESWYLRIYAFWIDRSHNKEAQSNVIFFNKVQHIR